MPDYVTRRFLLEIFSCSERESHWWRYSDERLAQCGSHRLRTIRTIRSQEFFMTIFQAKGHT